MAMTQSPRRPTTGREAFDAEVAGKIDARDAAGVGDSAQRRAESHASPTRRRSIFCQRSIRSPSPTRRTNSASSRRVFDLRLDLDALVPAFVSDALVIGAGPAGLMAAETLAARGIKVAIADASPQPARKFLLAGRGGLNLTHSEPLEAFLDRYGEARGRLEPAIRAFDPEALARLGRRARRADLRRLERARISQELQGDAAAARLAEAARRARRRAFDALALAGIRRPTAPRDLRRRRASAFAPRRRLRAGARRRLLATARRRTEAGWKPSRAGASGSSR